MTVTEILKALRNRLSDENLWWHGGGARNPENYECACVIASVRSVADDSEDYRAEARAQDFLDMAVPDSFRKGYSGGLRIAAAYNDTVADHPKILALVDKAIDLSKE